MSDVPLVSVCIPVRNGARELPHTLRNLLDRGTWPPDRLEVLVGDHGSDDGTAEVLARWPSVRRIPVPYRGPHRATVRNRLLREAGGAIVLFLDHDVLASDALVATHARLHREHPGSLVIGQTFGKDFLRADIDALVAGLDLDHIERSAEALRTTEGLGDPRSTPEMLGRCPGEPIDATRELAPWRYTWTCNLSARREDIDACGGFDEGYRGWGVEDDDFGLAFYRAGRRLLYSREAWAFHVPHPADTAGNLLSWRRNARRMFLKHPCRDFEYYLADALHGREMAAAKVRTERAIHRLLLSPIGGAVDVARRALGPPRGRRLLCFARSAEHAQALGATDALLPHAPADARPWDEGGVQCTSLLGSALPHADGEIDEAVVLLDGLVLLDEPLLARVAVELARVAKRLSLVSGPADPEELAALRRLFSRVRFEQGAAMSDQQPRAPESP